MEHGFGCLWIILGLVVLSILGVVWLIVSTKRDNTRRHLEVLQWAEDKEAQREAEEEIWDIYDLEMEIRSCFPYLSVPYPDDLTPEGLRAALAKALHKTPTLGTYSKGLPAPLPPQEERRRHLYVVGKTGSGKTTYLEHLIVKDIDAGGGVGVMAPEGELFRGRLLGLIPERRKDDVIYFCPGDPSCSLTFNPLEVEKGDDALRAAEDLFTIFKRALSGDELGPRMQPILQNAFAVLVGRYGATLWDVKRLLTDERFRDRVVRETRDEYVREFWEKTFPRLAKGSDLPLLTRLDHFLRPVPIRKSLCHPFSSFSIRKALQERKILLVDLFGLSEETRSIVGQLLLSKFQIELMRREISGRDPEVFSLYCDEFQTFAGFAEGVWRELLSRGRKYGLSLTLAHQFPSQLPKGVLDEIFGNVGSMVSFALGSKDAPVVYKEFLRVVTKKDGKKVEPLPVEELLELRRGQAYAKYAGGKAVKISLPGPLESRGASRAKEVMEASWRRFAAPPVVLEEKVEDEVAAPPPPPRAPQASPPSTPKRAEQPKPTAAAPTPTRGEAPPRQAKAPKPAPPEPRRPGKGGPEHTYLQELIKRWGEEHGFRSVIEEDLKGAGRVDVALYRDDIQIACEISISTTPEHEVENVEKCLSAGFTWVAVVSTKKRRLEKVKKLLSALPPDDQGKVLLTTPEEMLSFLDENPYTSEEKVVAGYKVKVRYGKESPQKESRIAAILAKGIKSLKP